jgi:hypothetical protein
VTPVIDSITLYWVTQTGPSSVRYYFESSAAMGTGLGHEPVKVPTVIANFPADIRAFFLSEKN